MYTQNVKSSTYEYKKEIKYTPENLKITFSLSHFQFMESISIDSICTFDVAL